MRRRTLIAAAAIAASTALALTGCAGGNLQSSGSSSSSGWNKPTASLKGVTLTYGGGIVGDPGLKQVMDSFSAATGAKFKSVAYPDPYEQTLLTKVAAGDMPDLAAWQPTSSELTALSASKNLLSLDGAPWISKLDPSVKNVTGFVGKTRYAALVSSPSVMGVYYNKALFAKYGITSAPTNFDDLVADAKKIKSQGGTPFYEAGGDQWPTQYWVQVQLAEAAKAGLWSKVNTNKEQFTSPAILDTITRYKSLVDDGLFNSDIKTGTFVNQANAVLKGKAAMAVQVNALLLQMQQVASTSEIDKAVSWFPISTSGTLATSIPDNKNGVVAFKTGNAKREAASKQFLNYWMTTDYSKYVAAEKTVSIEPSVATPSGVPQVAQTIAKSLGDSVGSMQSLAIANPDLYINLANMLHGTQTPEQVAETTQKQFAQFAKAEGASGF
jgi:raffinose/stachyose/melibiose transport system substrate-binding protein